MVTTRDSIFLGLLLKEVFIVTVSGTVGLTITFIALDRFTRRFAVAGDFSLDHVLFNVSIVQLKVV